MFPCSSFPLPTGLCSKSFSVQLSRYSSGPGHLPFGFCPMSPENDTEPFRNPQQCSCLEALASLVKPALRHFHSPLYGFPYGPVSVFRLPPADRPSVRLLHFCFSFLPRKEVIQPHLPIRLPCYDFTPVIGLALGGWLLAVTSPTLGTPNSHGVTGGVYKARERIHRGMLIRDY